MEEVVPEQVLVEIPKPIDDVRDNVSPKSVMDPAAQTQQQVRPVPIVQTARRSKRDVSSTIVYVGGQPIKRANMYQVNGTSYVYEATENMAVTPVTNKRPKQTPRGAKNQEKTPHHVPNKRETDRLQRKEDITKSIQKKVNLRQQFLFNNATILQPFLDDKVFQQIITPTWNNTGTRILEPPSIQMQPDSITADMRDYQLLGLDWMNRLYRKNIGMILGDEMGLGKTLQAISLIAHLKETNESHGPSLIVCPLTVLDSWRAEIQKWAPSLKFMRLHVSGDDPSSLQELPDFGQLDIVVTTYEMCKKMSSLWSRQHFYLLVLDEGHKIKNADSLVSQAVRKIHCENRLLLTGTPLANNLVELWSLLAFLMPDVFTSKAPFAEAFDLSLNLVDKTKLELAHRLLNVFMIRRLKAEVEKLMPKKIETKVTCPLSLDQIWWYKALLMKDMNILAKGETGKNKNVLNNLVMQLRKCCLHPFLFPGAEDALEEQSLEQLIRASGKLAVLDKVLRSLYKKNHRVVLFSQFVRVLDILDDYCRMTGWDYCRFDGGTGRAMRNYTVKSFNQPGSSKFIFLMSTRSGGMGINLQTADTCILYDSDWNPQPDIQAMARVHRIGQTKTVHVYRLVTEGTVEQRILERAEKKLYLDKVVMRDGSSQHGSLNVDHDDVDGGVSGERLFSTLRFGCSAVFGQGSDKNLLPSDQDIELITDRNRTEEFSHGKLKGGVDSNARDFDATTAFSATTDFGGIDFKAIREETKASRRLQNVHEMADVFQKRKRQNRIKMVATTNSGWGTTAVPVLRLNDYKLRHGERSVFEQELQGKKAATKCRKEKKTIDFESQTHCQGCGDGGTLYLCDKCPVSVHLACCNLPAMYSCPHHRCFVCQKSASKVGGILFPCNTCLYSFCEDHLPSSAKYIETNERMENLGYVIKHGVYIHCSPECEEYAKREFGFAVTENNKRKTPCPTEVDVSEYFGSEVDTSLEAPEKLMVLGKRRPPRLVNS